MFAPQTRRLLTFARELQRASTFEELLLTTREEVKESLGYEHAWLMISDAEQVLELRLIDYAGALRGEVWDVAQRLKVEGDAFLEEIVRSDEPVVVVDARTDPRTDKNIVALLGNRTIVNVPLRLLDKPFGAFGTGTFADEGCRAPTQDQLDYLVGMAGQLSVAAGRIRFLEERRRAEAALKSSEEDLRITLDSIGDAVIATDSAGRVHRMNPIAERLTGWTAAEARGRSLGDVFHILDEATRAPMESPVDRVLRDGVVGAADQPLLIARDGTERAIGETSAPIRDTAGAIRGVVLVFRDRTGERSADELRRAKDASEATNAELRAFSYSVSHDLRAPLRAIEGFSSLLRDGHEAALDEEGRSHVARIIANAQRMSVLIDALLELSRITSTPLRTERLDLTEIACSVVTAIRSADSGRNVEVDVASGLDAVADPRLTRAVLENLIRNAWKFTAKRADARISVGAERGEGDPVFFVRDNGAGFDMAYADKLFTPFQRLHRESDFEGSGIGLATVRRIVARHGGTVWADSAPGRGATFRFTLAGPRAGGS